MALLATRRWWRGSHSVATLGALVAAALLALAPAPVRASVVGEGDVLPNMPDPDPGDPPIPALPPQGGVIADDVIVGGTGTVGVIAPIGRVTVDVPGNTLPVESPNLYIGGAPEGLPGQTGTAGTQIIGGESLGLVTITGFFSEWRIEEQLVVGGFGQAFLDVLNGALVTVGDPLLTANVEDAYVGANQGSQGNVVVSGFGSRLSHDTLTVGFRGTGRIDVTSRGRLESRSGAILGDRVGIADTIPFIGNGTVYVDGLGSRWHVGDIEGPGDDDGIVIGDDGFGRVEVRNQGVVRVDGDVLVARGVDSYGEITVNGRDSLFWTFDNLSVGLTNLLAPALSTSEMHIENEGTLRVDSVMNIGRGAIVDLATGGVILTPTLFNGPVPGAGGVIRGDGRIDTGSAGVFTNNGDVRNAAGIANVRERLLFTGPVTNNDNIESVGGEMEFQGLVTNATPDSEIVGINAIFRFRGGFINAGGRLLLDNTLVETLGSPAPITSNAEMAVLANDSSSTISGNLVLGAANTLGMELGALNFSHLQVSGSATLAGILDISGVNGYIPTATDSFEIISANGIAGTFADVTDNISGFDFTAVYEPNRVLLNAVAGFVFSADFDGNMIVDFFDYLTWLNNYGAMGVPPGTMGDADGDGDVDDDDFAVWEDQLGTPGPAVPAVAAVPEPAAVTLALAAFGALWRRKRR